MGWIRYLVRRIREKGARHWITLAIVVIFGYLAGHSLESADFLSGVRIKLYRLQMKAYIHPQNRPQHTMVLMIRDEDYWGPEYGGRTPIDRAQLAQLLDRLRQANVARVVLDIDLRLPQYPKTDEDVATSRSKDKKDKGDTRECTALQCGKLTSDEEKDKLLLAAIKSFCGKSKDTVAKGHPILVLGTSVTFDEEAPGSRQGYYSEVPSIFTGDKNLLATKTNGDFQFLDQFSANDPSCPAKGYMQLPTDLRQIPEYVETKDENSLDSLSLTTAKLVDRSVKDRINWHSEDSFHFSHFLDLHDFGYDLKSGPHPVGETYVSFTQKMLASTDLSRDLEGKIVLIGGDWHTRAYGQGPSVDQYDSPVGVMPGVFLHANYIEAFLDERGLATPVHDAAVKITEWLLVFFLLILGLYEIEGRWKWALFASVLLGASLVIYVLLANVGIFMDFFIPICILIVHALLDDLFALLDELKRLRKQHKEDINATV